MGSASELEYQLILSKDLGFINDQIFKEQTMQVTEVKRMLTSLHQKVSSDWAISRQLSAFSFQYGWKELKAEDW